MNKVLKHILLAGTAALALASCAKQELLFNHEKPAANTEAGKILIEAILPTQTTVNDQIYIAGPFAGDSAYVVQSSMYALKHSEVVSQKWFIYLDPATFMDGKTLADGFYFVNVEQGIERSVKNEDILHKLDAVPGERYNVYADRWRSFFDVPEEDDGGIKLPDLEGYGLFVDVSGSTIYGEGSIALYAWGDGLSDANDLFGAWPGMQPTGTCTIEGREWIYFDLGAKTEGKTVNFIINNNDGGSQLENFDALKGQVIDHHFFFAITDDSVEVVDIDPNAPSEPLPDMEGFGLFVDASGSTIYGEGTIALYAWGDGLSDANDLFGAWPGMQPTGTCTYRGKEWIYFDLGEKTEGKTVNFIINNNDGGSQLENFDVLKGQVIDHNFFFAITDDSVEVAETGPDTPKPEPEAEDGPKVYVQNKTTWGGSLFAHYWGISETKWPGYELTETVTIGDATYLVLPTLHKNMGEEVGIIFHAEDDALRLESAITLDTDRYYTLTDDALVEDYMGVRLFVKNNSRWPGNLHAHIWCGEGDDAISTEWPGIKAVPGYAKGDVYDVLLVPDAFVGKTVNIIFHSDEDDSVNRFQTELAISGDIFYNLNIEYSLDEQEKDPVTLYVNDKTAWEEISVYLHGDINNLGGGWPGISMSRTEDICGITFKVFEVPNALTRNENLIFNNGGNGIQLDDFNITFTEDEYYLIVTAEGVTLTERPVPSRVTFFVDDQTGWDAISLYQWGDVGDLGGGWPGAQVGGTVTIGETAYKVFTAEQAAGLSQHLIFNNNGAGTQLADFDLTFEKSEYFLTVTAEGVALKDAPNSVVIFVDDQTGWDAIALYQWGEVGDLGGGWPGAQVQTTVTANGKTYKVFVADNAIGLSQNLIFNNNGGGIQLGDYPLTFEKNTYYLKVTTEGVELN